jgi:DNA-binding CsgD family transcriptional regulator
MGIYHVMILVDLLALSLGVGIIFVALLSWERSGIRWLRDLALVLVGATILLMLDILRIYETTAGWPPGPAGRTVLAVLSGTGNLVLVIAVPVFVNGITPLPPHWIRRVARPIATVLLPITGVLDEGIDLAVFHVANDLSIALLLAAAALALAIGYRSISEPETRRMVNRMMWATIATVILGRVQLAVTSFLGIALELRRVRLVQVLYYLVLIGLVFLYAAKHLFRRSGTTDLLPSQQFVDRYGISNRERDIIAMIVQGHANRLIGERLFISDRTVKNHISSIYRKTTVVNKVQLLNLVRNNPGPRDAPSGPDELSYTGQSGM